MSARCSGFEGSVFAPDLAVRFQCETTADEVSDEAKGLSELESSSDNDATENEEDLPGSEHSDDATLSITARCQILPFLCDMLFSKRLGSVLGSLGVDRWEESKLGA